MKLSIVIVSWNQQKDLRKTLEGLKKTRADFEFDIYVVDNNSEDDTLRMMRGKFQDVNLIDNEVNFGFGRAVNQVIKQIESDYLLVINPGIIVREDTVQKVFETMNNNPKASALGIKVLDRNGDIKKCMGKFPNAFQVLKQALCPNKKYFKEHFDYNKDSKIDFIDSGFFAINLRTIADLKMYLDRTLPKFDNRYFSFFEKLDYSRQIYKSEGEVWYTTLVECVDARERKVLNRIQEKYFKDSMLKYVKKWHGKFLFLILRILFLIKK